MKHFAKEFPILERVQCACSRNSIKQYLKMAGSEEEITQLAKKRSGSPLTLENLDERVKQYITVLRKAGTPVNARVVLADAEGILTATDRTVLFENGGYLDWAYSLLRRMGYVK